MADTTPNPSRAARIAGWVADAAALGAAVAIVHGVDLIFRPAAFIIGGLMTLSGAWLYARKAAPPEDAE
jgi:hypothetical protein